MRLRTALSIVTLFLFCFTLAVWATPLDARSPLKSDPVPETVSGRIIAVSDAELALEVSQGQQRIKVLIRIDAKTMVDGKLSIGSQATVEYRSQNADIIATHISVLPASGLHSK